MVARRSVRGMGSSFEKMHFDEYSKINKFQKAAIPFKKVFFYTNGLEEEEGIVLPL